MWFKKKTAEEITQMNRDRRNELLKSTPLETIIEERREHNISLLIGKTYPLNKVENLHFLCKQIVKLQEKVQYLESKAYYLENQQDVIFDILRELDVSKQFQEILDPEQHRLERLRVKK